MPATSSPPEKKVSCENDPHHHRDHATHLPQRRTICDTETKAAGMSKN